MVHLVWIAKYDAADKHGLDSRTGIMDVYSILVGPGRHRLDLPLVSETVENMNSDLEDEWLV